VNSSQIATLIISIKKYYACKYLTCQAHQNFENNQQNAESPSQPKTQFEFKSLRTARIKRTLHAYAHKTPREIVLKCAYTAMHESSYHNSKAPALFRPQKE